MSDLAICESGEQKTASEFHDDYVLYGMKHKDFICPFCYIELVAKAIYVDGPQGKSPHFSCFPKKPHVNGCDGYPLVDGKTARKSRKDKKVRIGKEEFSFPEKLVPRSEPSARKFVDASSRAIKSNDPNKVAQRRSRAGEEVGSARYTSSLIRSFASSRKAIISRVYKYAREENLSDDEIKVRIKSALSQAPIDLEGYQTTYRSAFQGTRYHSKYKKIWNGKGSVIIKDNVVYILSNDATEYEADGSKQALKFYVRIEIPQMLEELPRYHQDMINRLLIAREQEAAVKWFGYGLASIKLDKNAVLLRMGNLDHFFVEKVKQKSNNTLNRSS